MIIVLDTTVFHRDVNASRDWLSTVLDGASNGHYEVVVPESVIRELVRQYPFRIRAAARDLNKAIGTFVSELRALELPIPSLLEPDVEELGRIYETRLRARLSGTGIRVASIPNLQPALTWAVERRKPFKDDGRGLADAAVWLTVLQVVPSEDEVLLVSANSSDFGNGHTPVGLADELADDLDHLGAAGRVRLIPGIKELIDEVITPLAATDARARRLIFGDLWSDLSEAIAGVLAYQPVPQDELDLGVDLDEDPQLQSIVLTGPDLVSARQIGPKRLLLVVDIDADLELIAYVYRADFYATEETNSVSITDPNWNERYIEGEASISTRMSLELGVDEDGTNVEVQILSAERVSVEAEVDHLLNEPARSRLLDEVADAIQGWHLAAYVPSEGLQSQVDEATIEDFVGADVTVDVARPLRSAYHCWLIIDGLATVRWVVNAPSGFDVERYASSAEGPPGGGEWLEAVSNDDPVTLIVQADLSGSGEWLSIDIESVEIPVEVLASRRADSDVDASLVERESAHLTEGRSIDPELDDLPF